MTMTIAEKYTAIINALTENGIDLDFEGQTAQDFLADRIEKSKKKSTKSKKVSDAQTYLREAILNVLDNTDEPLTVGEIVSLITVGSDAPDGVKVSSQSVTANLRPYLNTVVSRNEEKGVARFSLVRENTPAVEGEEE